MVFFNAFILHGKASNNLDTVSPKPTSTPRSNGSYYQVISLLDTKYFDIKSAFSQAPSDIVEHLYYPGGFGGVLPSCDPKNSKTNGVWIETGGNEILEIMQDTRLLVCGWEVDEKIEIKISSPDGSTIVDQAKADLDYGADVGSIEMVFETDLKDIPGTYRITFKGISDSVSTEMRVRKPSVPRVYFYEGNLVFVNFPSRDKVRLFAYKSEAETDSGIEYHDTFIAWQQYTTNNDGYLIISVSDDSLHYYVVSESVGIQDVYLQGLNTYFNVNHFKLITTNARQPYTPIADCAKSRIYTGDNVILDNTDYVTIRSTPDTHPTDNRIGRLEPGEIAHVVDGPICNYGWILWEIENSDGIHGWIPETNGQEFWLIAIDQ